MSRDVCQSIKIKLNLLHVLQTNPHIFLAYFVFGNRRLLSCLMGHSVLMLQSLFLYLVPCFNMLCYLTLWYGLLGIVYCINVEYFSAMVSIQMNCVVPLTGSSKSDMRYNHSNPKLPAQSSFIATRGD